MSTLDTEISADDLAGLFRVTRRRIDQLAQQGSLVRVARGRFRLVDAVHAMLDQLEEREGPSELQAERLLKITAERKLVELELARQRGLVGAIQDFEDIQSRSYAMVQHGMMQLPARLAIRLLNEGDETTFKQVVKHEVTLVLNSTAAAIKAANARQRAGKPVNEQNADDEN